MGRTKKRTENAMHRLHALFLALAATGAFTLGCGSDPAPAAKTPAGTGKTAATAGTPSTTTDQKGDKRSPTAGSIHIDDKILKACGDLPKAHFAFDSASIDAEVANVLDALARCFTTGPLKDKGMKVVGHADPRGETEYNFGLGQQRAGSVAEFLVKKGMGKARIQSSSQGEIEASGVDEEGWARDRKVDIFLAD
jgi:peptidoglycan-associated lipoprotein